MRQGGGGGGEEELGEGDGGDGEGPAGVDWHFEGVAMECCSVVSEVICVLCIAV